MRVTSADDENNLTNYHNITYKIFTSTLFEKQKKFINLEAKVYDLCIDTSNVSGYFRNSYT